MDYMSYSYDMRATLAKISALLGNGKEKEWNDKAKAVQDKIKSYLWDDSRGACFDRDNRNKMVPTLLHNNLRAMYHGAFTQEMADRFVKEHLLNPDEFFTPMPLPSIAVNDPLFRNGIDNDWSGPPMGLTYQRAILALENYGYFAEITLLGEKLIATVARKNTFAQQFDPFTGEFGVIYTRTD
jgi:neutral trehalase